MQKLNLDRPSLRRFGLVMGIAFLVISFFVLIKHKHGILPTSIISAAFIITAFFMPVLLKPIYVLWMKLAFLLGWLNTRLILFIMFYLIFTPMGLVIKLFGVDSLDRKIEKDKKSYWNKKEKKEFNPLNYQRQF